MPKENTHIFFAANLIERLGDAQLRTILETRREYFLLGAIIPDTLYYSSHPHVSDNLHGKEGNPTNVIIQKMLEDAQDDRNLAFCLGYISHCALDIIFHPVVYYLSGNYYDPDPNKRDMAVYLHRHIETCLDSAIQNPLRIYKELKAEHIQGLAYEKIIGSTFGIDTAIIAKTLQKQLTMNRFFNSRLTYILYMAFVRMGLIKDWKSKGLFYANSKTHACQDFAHIEAQHLITGEHFSTNADELFEKAYEKAIHMITQAHAYARGEISREELISAIPGESLDTGLLNTPVSYIKHTKNN